MTYPLVSSCAAAQWPSVNFERDSIAIFHSFNRDKRKNWHPNGEKKSPEENWIPISMLCSLSCAAINVNNQSLRCDHDCVSRHHLFERQSASMVLCRIFTVEMKLTLDKGKKLRLLSLLFFRGEAALCAGIWGKPRANEYELKELKAFVTIGILMMFVVHLEQLLHINLSFLHFDVALHISNVVFFLHGRAIRGWSGGLRWLNHLSFQFTIFFCTMFVFYGH